MRLKNIYILFLFTLLSATGFGQNYYNHSKTNPLKDYQEDITAVISNFKTESGFDVQIITSYQYSDQQFSNYVNGWGQNATNSGLLIAFGTTGDGWEENLRVEFSSDFESSDRFTAASVQVIVEEVMIPLLDGEDVNIINDLGQPQRVSFGSNLAHFKSIEIGLSELLRGRAAGENEDTNDGGNHNLDEGEVQVGPVVLIFSDTPTNSSTDREGYCVYNDIAADVRLSVNDPLNGAYTFTLPAAQVSFKQHCENKDFRDLTIQWSDDEGSYIGKVGFMDAQVKSADLKVNSEGILTGDLSFSGSLDADQVVEDIFIFRGGLGGDFGFTYAGNDTDEGTFDFSSLQNIQIDLSKSSTVLASLQNVTLDASGRINGKFVIAPGEVSYTTSQFKVDVDQLDLDVTYTVAQGFVLNGTSAIKLSEISVLDGSLDIGLLFEDNIISTTVATEQLSAFGMELTEFNVNAQLTKAFDLVQITGSMIAKHPEFNTTIEVQDFLYTQDGLQNFVAAGSVSYDAYSLILQESTYEADNGLISFDLLAEVAVQGAQVTLEVDGFTIDLDGNIVIGELSQADVDLVAGPLVISFEGDTDSDGNNGKIDGRQTTLITGAATISLRTISPNGDEQLKEISQVDVSYRRYKRGDQELISADLIWTGDLGFGDVMGVDAALTGANLHVDADGNLTGSLTMDGSLTEDKTLKDIFILKSGLSGQLTYNFDGTNSFNGNFDLSSLQNINLVINKSGTDIARLENGTFDANGVLSGTFSALENASFNSNLFNLTLNQLNLSGSYSFEDNDLVIGTGDGKITISDITGVEGNVVLDLTYAVDDNFTAQILTDETNISALGLTLSNFSLLTEFTSDFELSKITGSLKAQHTNIETTLDISLLTIENGELTELNAAGSFVYQGFDFKLSSCTYASNVLTFDTELEMNVTGTAADFGVREFTIDENGDISVGEISGRLDQGNHLGLSFKAQIGESRLQGEFEGSLKSIGVGVAGVVDFGKENDYYFAYLDLEGRANIPIPATGLKITRLGGQIGYNYKLTYDDQIKGFSGSPKNGNYLIGLTLGIADQAGIVEIVGNPIAQFSSSTLDLSLRGQLNITKNNPMLSSDIDVNYALPSNDMAGSITTTLQIPENSGRIFNANSTLNFGSGNNEWFVNGQGQANLLEIVRFNGNFGVSGRYDPFLLNQVNISGTANLDYDLDYSLNILNTGVQVFVNGSAHFNAHINANLDRTGLTAEVGVNLSASATMGASYKGISYDLVGASGNLSGVMGYANNEGYIRGSFDYEVSFLYMDWGTIPVNVDYAFEGGSDGNFDVDATGGDEGEDDDNPYARFDQYTRIKAISGLVYEIEDWSDEKLADLDNDLSNTSFNNAIVGNVGLVHAWQTLHGFTSLRKSPGLLDIIKRVAPKFEYNGQTGYTGFAAVLDGHVSVQKFLANLSAAYAEFGSQSGITITGVKSSQEGRVLDSNGELLATYVDGAQVVESKFAAFPNISRLSDDAQTKLDEKNWSQDLLIRFDNDLDTDALSTAIDEDPDLLGAWKIASTHQGVVNMQVVRDLGSDFRANSDLESYLEDGMNFTTWRSIMHLVSFRSSPDFLEWVRKASSSNLPNHLIGEVNGSGAAVGCHILSAVGGNRVQISNPSLTVRNAGGVIIRAKIRILNPATNEFVEKGPFSTFFPKTWDVNRTIEEIAAILVDPTNQENTRRYSGLASDNVTTIVVTFGGTSGNLVFNTAYPDY